MTTNGLLYMMAMGAAQFTGCLWLMARWQEVGVRAAREYPLVDIAARVLAPVGALTGPAIFVDGLVRLVT